MTYKEFTEKYKIWEFKKYSILRWIAFFSAIIFILQCLCFFIAQKTTSSDNLFLVVWLTWFQYFGIQTNILIGVYLIWYWINPQCSLLNGKLLIYVMTYACTTFLIYSCALLPNEIINKHFNGLQASAYVVNVFEHYLVPISIFVFYGCYLRYSKNKFIGKNNDYWKTIGMGMIYPTIYVIYCICLPFMSNHTYSVYCSFTNCDSKCLIDGANGSPINLLYIIGALILIFGLLNFVRIPFYEFKKKGVPLEYGI